MQGSKDSIFNGIQTGTSSNMNSKTDFRNINQGPWGVSSSDLKSSLSFFYFHSLDLLNNFKQMICYFCDSQNFLSHLEHLSSNSFLDRSTQWQFSRTTVTGWRESSLKWTVPRIWTVLSQSGRSWTKVDVLLIKSMASMVISMWKIFYIY